MNNTLKQTLHNSYLPSLNGIRAIAVIMVMGYHYLGWPTGRLGVNIFFALSGFLITWLLLKETKSTSNIDLKLFYLRRSLRIFPAYYCFLIIALTIEYFQGSQNLSQYIAPAFLYYFNYYAGITGNEQHALSHIWSLSVEEQFYILWPFLLLYFTILKKGYIFKFIIFTLLLIVIWRSIAFGVLEFTEKYMYRAFDTRFDSLLVGCLFALLTNEKKGYEFIDRYIAKPIPLLLACILLAGSMYLTHISALYGYALGFTVDGFLISVIIICCIKYSQNFYIRWLELKTLVYLGMISYPMYLYHELAAGVANKGWEIVGNWLGFTPYNLLIVLCSTIGTIILASLSFYFVEKPFLKLKDKISWTKPHKPHQALSRKPLSID